jgi:predicted HTH transcriptional regulator
MNLGQLLAVLAKGEGRRIEFKLRVPSLPRLARSICAFANTEGGMIVAGVDDDGHAVGVDSVEETGSAFHDALAYLDPRPEISTTYVSLNGADLVVCRITRGGKKPYQAVSERGAITYIRVGATIRPVAKKLQLSDEDILRKRIRLNPLQKALMDAIGKNEGITLSRLSAGHNLSKQRTLKLLVPLLRSGMVLERDGGYMLR